MGEEKISTMLRIGAIFGVASAIIFAAPPAFGTLDLGACPSGKTRSRSPFAGGADCTGYTENRTYAKHAAFFFLTQKRRVYGVVGRSGWVRGLHAIKMISWRWVLMADSNFTVVLK